MSRNEYVNLVSMSLNEGISPLIILQKIQDMCVWGSGNQLKTMLSSWCLDARGAISEYYWNLQLMEPTMKRRVDSGMNSKVHCKQSDYLINQIRNDKRSMCWTFYLI